MSPLEAIRYLRALPPDEPVFVLRGRDGLAADIVQRWAVAADRAGSPKKKVESAYAVAHHMKKWPVKRVPGCPETEEVTT